jgi:hypothetical protein
MDGELRAMGENALHNAGTNPGSSGKMRQISGSIGFGLLRGTWGGRGGYGSHGQDGGDGGAGGAGGGGGGGAGGTIKLTSNVITGTFRFDARGGSGDSTGARGRFIVDALAGDKPGTSSSLATVYNSTGSTVAENPYDQSAGDSPLLGQMKSGPDVYGILSGLDAAAFEALPFVQLAPDQTAMLVKMTAGPPPYDFTVPGYHWVFFVNMSTSSLPSPRFQYGSTGGSNEYELRESGRAHRNADGSVVTPFENRPVIPALAPGEVFATLCPTSEGRLSASYLAGATRVGVFSNAAVVDSPIYMAFTEPPTLANSALTIASGSFIPDLELATGASPGGGEFTGTGVSLIHGKYRFNAHGMPPGTLVTVTYTTQNANSSNSTTFTIFVSSPRLYVNRSVVGGDGSGYSWENAMPELRTAVATAQSDPIVR